MKSIRRQDFRKVGIVSKLHGTKGELRLILDSPSKLKEWVFLLIKEKPVPFLLESIKGSPEEPIVKLFGIDNNDLATALVDKAVLVQGKERKQKKVESESFIGFTIFDGDQNEIGIIEEILEMPQQLIAKLTYKGAEVLIPLAEDWIVEIDPAALSLYLELPDGLLPE